MVLGVCGWLFGVCGLGLGFGGWGWGQRPQAGGPYCRSPTVSISPPQVLERMITGMVQLLDSTGIFRKQEYSGIISVSPEPVTGLIYC